MKVTLTNITYERKYSTGPFENHTLTIGSTIEGGPTFEAENTSDVFDELKNKIESWHMANQIAEDAKNKWAANPRVYADSKGIHPPQPIDPPHKDEYFDEKDPVLRVITESTSLEELAKYKDAALNSGYLHIYMNKAREFTKAIK